MEDRTLLESQVPAGYAGGPEATRVMNAPVGAPGAEATRVMGAPTAGVPGGYEATQQAIVVNCPVCGTPNGPGERYCQDCGLLFGSAGENVEPLPDLSALPRLTDASGRDFPLNPGANVVGRDAADVLIPDATVSRRHAQLTLEGGRLVVEDLGSTNGSRVNDRKLAAGERADAFHGDSVRFGNITLTLSLPGGEARPEAPATPAAPAVPAAAPAPAEDRGPAVGMLSLEDGTEFPLYAGVNTIGRRSGNQVVLADAFMSGKHAEITLAEDGSGQFVDVGSTNGSYLEGERLAPNAPVTMRDGLVLRLGKTSVTYRPAAGAGTPISDFALPQPAAAAAATPAEPQAAEPAGVPVTVIEAAGEAPAELEGQTAGAEFRVELEGLLDQAQLDGEPSVDVNAGLLHRLVGGYPGPDHRMPLCCQVLRQAMRPGDEVISEPPSGAGASLTVRYRLPR